MKREPLARATRFGSIFRLKNSSKLQITFSYLGERVRLSTGYEDNITNRELLTVLLGRIREEVQQGIFSFVRTFPKAPEPLKRRFSLLEGREYNPEPHQVTFGDYLNRWKKIELVTYTDQLKEDYENIINSRLSPYFRSIAFDHITATCIKDFIEDLRHREGEKKGQYLSIKRIKNVMTVFRAIFEDACDRYQWKDLRYPVESIKKKIDAVRRKTDEDPAEESLARSVLLFSEWMRLTEKIDTYYQPLFNVMAMTGMIFSEMKGLKRDSIKLGHIEVKSVIVRGREKLKPKTKYRVRKIPLTARLRSELKTAMSQGSGEYVFDMRCGSMLNYTTLLNLWKKATREAGIAYRVPYVMRHNFAEWALLIGVAPSRLQAMMGHGSRKMINEVYGNYRDGLISERSRILEYFGADFLDAQEAGSISERLPQVLSLPSVTIHRNSAFIAERQKMVVGLPAFLTQKAQNVSTPLGQSDGQSFGLFADNYLKTL
ncbi:putative lambdoid prophage Rac integrase [Geobacter sp. OR-1]|uniref:tyrosine-type recombinase/integrase n=1 Tax=Geobacter sp. OR-1 TaxID=1266765 RepID=UPI000542B98C|nr:tyrosine-type recombinase/integrase [Geobacter sp. OR-1]GAM11339.1 putative lambdoid prophage Rac integrase [Geobacter sp. OR-1]